MIADDEPIMRKALIHLIHWHELGCELVYAAYDGQDLIEQLEQIQPDIVICDIKMPRVDGIEVAKYLWEKQSHTKLIILTAYADFSFAQSAIKYGVVEYVTKTGALEGVIEAVERCKLVLKREQQEVKHEVTYETKLNFLKSIIDSSLFNELDITTLQQHYEVSISNFIVLNVTIHKQTETTAIDATKLANITKLLYLALNDYETYIIPLTKHHICVIINEVSEYKLLKIQSLCLEFISNINKMFHEAIFIGISEPTLQLLSLHNAFKQANLAISQRFLNEQTQVYLYKQLPNVTRYSKHSKQMDKLIDHIQLYLQKGSTDNVLIHLHSLLELFKTSEVPTQDIISTGLVIANMCKKYVILDEYVEPLISEQINVFTQSISQSKLFSEYAQALIDVVTLTAQHIHQYNNGKHNIVLDAMHYIQSNYDKAITLNDIANHVNTNSSYLSRLFKEKTGDTIINTINKLKIEKAKHCLSHTNMRVYEIAQVIGIEDTAYFSHFFKKYTKMSPKQFQNQKQS